MTLRLLCVGVGLLVAGCNGNQAETTPDDLGMSGNPQAMQQMRACPMQVEGTVVEVEDTDDGVALVFTTPTGDVAELRDRVQHMGMMLEHHGADGRMHWGRDDRVDGRGQMRGPRQGTRQGQGARRGPQPRGPMRLPDVDTAVEEIDQGARLVIRPRDEAQLARVRETAHRHHDRLRQGDCLLMRRTRPRGS